MGLSIKFTFETFGALRASRYSLPKCGQYGIDKAWSRLRSMTGSAPYARGKGLRL